jgi:hypothetical protein
MEVLMKVSMIDELSCFKVEPMMNYMEPIEEEKIGYHVNEGTFVYRSVRITFYTQVRTPKI